MSSLQFSCWLLKFLTCRGKPHLLPPSSLLLSLPSSFTSFPPSLIPPFLLQLLPSLPLPPPSLPHLPPSLPLPPPSLPPPSPPPHLPPSSLTSLPPPSPPSLHLRGDLQYLSRLVRLIKHFVPLSALNNSATPIVDHTPTRTRSLPASLSSLSMESQYLHGKCCILAFDAFYEKDGTRSDAKTTFYVPNDYSLRLGAEFPEYFYPVGSVNPYRPDAERELERCAARGITIIKWLVSSQEATPLGSHSPSLPPSLPPFPPSLTQPNSMGIHPGEKECDNFYRKMKALDMVMESLLWCGVGM